MRSPGGDRTSRAVIRDDALRLFAARDVNAVTVRDIATASGSLPRWSCATTCPRTVCEPRSTSMWCGCSRRCSRRRAPEGSAPFDVPALPSLAEQVARHLPTGSPIPAYLARLLIDGGPEATALFAKLSALGQAGLAGLIEAGSAVDGGDPLARAAFLLANDLAVIMLRDRLHEVLGVNPLSVEGLHRWGRQVHAVYHGGLAARHPEQP